jgi:large subunit ribosomal protein L3
MSIGILGKKIGMTQIFDETGCTIPVTLIKVGPCFITQIFTKIFNGYNAIQLGYVEINSKKLTKPELGHLNKNNLPPFRFLKEYKITDIENFTVGQKLDVNLFNINTYIDITATTIGKGFAGNVKRNHFATGPQSHGSKFHRAQGSIGAGTTPSRVWPGKRMAGHLGNKKCTLKSLKIVDINIPTNILVLKGSIPGKSNNLISIKKI